MVVPPSDFQEIISGDFSACTTDFSRLTSSSIELMEISDSDSREFSTFDTKKSGMMIETSGWLAGSSFGTE